MQNAPENDSIARARHGRQVFAGSDLHPPDQAVDLVAADGSLRPEQIVYLLGIIFLLIIGLILLWISGIGLATSVAFALLALALIAAWFLF